jgi:hypothetical protein
MSGKRCDSGAGQVGEKEVIQWLLEGDPSIRWQTLRDLQDAPPTLVARERRRVVALGWGSRLLAQGEPDGTWGGGLYNPKWISTTYTLLSLRRIGLPVDHARAALACQQLLEGGFYPSDGGINFFPRSHKQSETCITGMVLSLLAYFRYPDDRVHALAEHLLAQQMPDGGWNCQSYRGATHSSFHTTISALEGLWLYEQLKPEYVDRVRLAQAGGRAFLLAHRLFRSDRTGEVVKLQMTRFSFPPRWHYDVLRGLDYFRACGADRDPRLEDAMALVLKKRRKDGRWPLQNRHPGRTFFEMEKPGKPSRWNTLRALRVLRWWEEG